MVEKKTENRWKWKKTAERLKKCVEQVWREIWLREWMKKALSDTFEAGQHAARQKLLSLAEYDLTAKQTRPEKGAELEQKLRNKKHEGLVKVRGDSENDVSRAWRMKAIGEIAYSGGKVNGVSKNYGKKDFLFKKMMALEVVAELKGYQVEWQKNGNRNYEHGTVMPLVQLDEWNECVVTKTEMKNYWVSKGRQCSRTCTTGTSVVR